MISSMFSCVAFQSGMKLPGSRPDVVRNKILAGPSPVGGAYGGLQSQTVYSLDEFELQAAYYNMACIHSKLGDPVKVRCTYLQSVCVYLCLCVCCCTHYGSLTKSTTRLSRTFD